MSTRLRPPSLFVSVVPPVVVVPALPVGVPVVVVPAVPVGDPVVVIPAVPASVPVPVGVPVPPTLVAILVRSVLPLAFNVVLGSLAGASYFVDFLLGALALVLTVAVSETAPAISPVAPTRHVAWEIDSEK